MQVVLVSATLPHEVLEMTHKVGAGRRAAAAAATALLPLPLPLLLLAVRPPLPPSQDCRVRFSQAPLHCTARIALPARSS